MQRQNDHISILVRIPNFYLSFCCLALTIIISYHILHPIMMLYKFFIYSLDIRIKHGRQEYMHFGFEIVDFDNESTNLDRSRTSALKARTGRRASMRWIAV